MKIYVIVVTYNGRKWYDECIGSIRNSSVPVQTIVIDNASSDDTVSYIKEKYPEIYLVENDKNLGFGKANNIGIKYALEQGADYVYLLNQDAWVEPKTFETLINVSMKNPDYGIISPMQITASGVKLDKNFSAHCKIMLDDLYFNMLKDIYEVDYVMAAHWLLTKDCLMVIGGFSPLFPHYGEDNNLCVRAKYHGFKVGICTIVQGVHDREFRQCTKQQQIYRQYIALLIISTNITCSIYKRILNLLKKIIISIYTLKSLRLIFVWYRWLIHLPAIYRHNKETKKQDAAFLKVI